jgi:hypothetical protein
VKRIALFLLSFFLLALVLFAIAIYIPIPLDPYLDFQVLHRADSGILHGIPLYDRAGQAQRVADDLNVSVDKVLVLPFPYPPWYAVFTLPLALLSIDVGVRMWFLLNIAMLLASVWLLTDGWQPRKRLYSFIAAFLFLPTFGALIVGQYVFPTILGMALIIYALKHQRVGLLALGMALVTFKPHIGIFLLLAVIVHLLLRRDDFGRRLGSSIRRTIFIPGRLHSRSSMDHHLSSIVVQLQECLRVRDLRQPAVDDRSHFRVGVRPVRAGGGNPARRVDRFVYRKQVSAG